MKTKLVTDYDALLEPGDYMFTSDMRRILIFIPSGVGVVGLDIGSDSAHPCWQLSGTRECPTLSPSINCIGVEKWHGWLKNGELISC